MTSSLSSVGNVTIGYLWESVAKPLLWLLWLKTGHPKLRGVNPLFAMLTESMGLGFGQGPAGRAHLLTHPTVHAGPWAETSAVALIRGLCVCLRLPQTWWLDSRVEH